MTALTEKQQDVIARVQKLLALAGNNTNEHEAQAAASKAMDLLSAYNLSMHQVGSKPTDKARKDTKKRGGLYQWQRELWGAVAKLNFCVYFSIKGTAKGSTYEHRLVGSEVNVVSTEVMADYLQAAVERAGQAYAKSQGFNSVFVKQAIAYREGMADRLKVRLNELRERRVSEERAKRNQQPGSTSNALILADVIQSEDDLNNDYFNKLEPGTTARNRAEAEARFAAYQETAKAKQAEHEAKMLKDPEYAAAFAAKVKEDEAYWEGIKSTNAKKDAARDRARARNAGKPGYDDAGYKLQYRAMTAKEQRARLGGYYNGYEDGKTVNLDQQIDEEEAKKAIEG